MYRKIVTEYWSDPKVEQLGWAGKYVLLYLLTSPLGSLSGCFVMTVKRIAKDTELDIDMAAEGMREVIESGIVEYCDETEEVLIKSWPRYNWNASPNMIKGLANSINDVKCEAFREHLQSCFEAITEQSGSGLKAASKRLDSHPTVSVSVTDNSKGVGVKGGGGSKPSKHRHGEFSNVLLTDNELALLKERFPKDWEERIDDLSYYIGSKGDKYKSHYRTILSWDRMDSNPSKKYRREVKTDARFSKYD